MTTKLAELDWTVEMTYCASAVASFTCCSASAICSSSCRIFASRCSGESAPNILVFIPVNVNTLDLPCNYTHTHTHNTEYWLRQRVVMRSVYSYSYCRPNLEFRCGQMEFEPCAITFFMTQNSSCLIKPGLNVFLSHKLPITITQSTVTLNGSTANVTTATLWSSAVNNLTHGPL